MLGESKRLQAQIVQLQKENGNLRFETAKQQSLLRRQAELALDQMYGDGAKLQPFEISYLSYDIERFNRLTTSMGAVRGVRFTDGLLLRGRTKGGLEDRQHTLVIGGQRYSRDSDLVYYERSATNVDCQSIGSGTVQHYGTESLAADPLSVLSVVQLAGAVAVSARQRWPHALEWDDIEFARINPLESQA
jgi:hypothetical protein